MTEPARPPGTGRRPRSHRSGGRVSCPQQPGATLGSSRKRTPLQPSSAPPSLGAGPAEHGRPGVAAPRHGESAARPILLSAKRSEGSRCGDDPQAARRLRTAGQPPRRRPAAHARAHVPNGADSPAVRPGSGQREAAGSLRAAAGRWGEELAPPRCSDSARHGRTLPAGQGPRPQGAAAARGGARGARRACPTGTAAPSPGGRRCSSIQLFPPSAQGVGAAGSPADTREPTARSGPPAAHTGPNPPARPGGTGGPGSRFRGDCTAQDAHRPT